MGDAEKDIPSWVGNPSIAGTRTLTVDERGMRCISELFFWLHAAMQRVKCFWKISRKIPSLSIEAKEAAHSGVHARFW